MSPSPTFHYDTDPVRRMHNRNQLKERLKQETSVNRVKFDALAAEAIDAYSNHQELESSYIAEQANNPDFAYADVVACVRKIGQAWVVIAAYILSLLLIYLPTAFIAERNFGNETWQANLAIFVIPIAMLLFQIMVADQRSQQQHYWLWRLVSLLLIFLTPMLLVATFLAKQVTLQQVPQVHDVLLLLALMSLAFITDSVIIYGGNGALEPWAFIVFRLNQFQRRLRLRWLETRFVHYGKEAEQELHRYHEAVSIYNSAFPNNLHNPPPFNETSQLFLKIWLSYDPFPKHLKSL